MVFGGVMIWNLSVRIKSFFNPRALRREEIEKLHAIAKHWHHLGQCKFASATNYPEGSIERRFVEHGAWNDVERGMDRTSI